MNEPGFFPQGVGLTPAGDTQYMEETFTNMGVALLHVVHARLHADGDSLRLVPGTADRHVLGSAGVIGALIFLAILGNAGREQAQSLNIISMLGIIMLFGLVAKNGILLVDYSNTLCKRGMRVNDAVLQAASTRFRPIIMTTAAMIFGMLPLSLGFAEGR